jgi:hypothetical protein
MRLLTILLLVFIQASVLLAQIPYLPPNSVPSELEGNKLGESLESFVSSHPKAQCVATTTTIRSCSQWENISILGMAAHADPACSPEALSSQNCAEGLYALFRDNRLFQISYAVGGTDKSAAVTYFKKNYGKPSIDTPAYTVWKSKERTFSVTVGKLTRKVDEPILIHLTLLSTMVGVFGGRSAKPETWQ